MDDAAAIVVIGNEILSGKVRDTNSPWLVEELRALGTAVRWIQVVPDEVPVIAEAVLAASRRCAHVITSGGVGPTLDDVTYEGVALAFGLALRQDPTLEAVIRGHFKEQTLDSHLKMSTLPEGAELLWTPGVSWPGVMVRNVLVLPGDPGFLRRKFSSVKERFRSRPFHLRRVFTHLEEGALSPHLDAVHEAHPAVALGSYPVYDRPDYSVMVTLEAKDAGLVARAAEDLVARLDPASIARVE